MGLVLGQGIYVKGRYPAGIDGVHTREYKIWCGVLKRCQPNGTYHQGRTSYLDCVIDSRFIIFQDFAEWCQHQIGFNADSDLDKDILLPGNRVYGPDTCCFVPKHLNNLITHQKSDSKYPTGVHYQPIGDKYKSQIRCEGVQKYLGSFSTVDDASHAYQVAKLQEIHRLAHKYKNQIDVRVFNALMKYDLNSKPSTI